MHDIAHQALSMGFSASIHILQYAFPMAFLVAQKVESLPAMQETWVQSLGGEDSPGEGNDNPLQYSCLESPTDRGAWRATVHGVAESQTRLRYFTIRLRICKLMANLDSMLKSRGITLSTKVCIVKAMVFPVVTLDSKES